MNFKKETKAYPKYDDLTDIEKSCGIVVANIFKTLLGQPKRESRMPRRGKDGEIRVTLSYCNLPIGHVEITTIDGYETKTFFPEA